MNTSKQLCAQPGYSTLKINVHAVSSGYPQVARETMLKSKKHRIANDHAVKRGLGAELHASVSVIRTRALKRSACADNHAQLKKESIA